jgi:hypothetical protein
LPSIGNLALIDSIIKQHLQIFVVPKSVIAKFTFPTDLPSYAEMYVTVAKDLNMGKFLEV